MEGTTIYPGSIGELIQGNYKGMDVLVSCPINLYTKVKVFESKKTFNKMQYGKAATFLENILKQWGYNKYIDTLDIDICSQIPKGKGFASSTADLCGTYYSLLKLFNREFNEEELIANCIKIEPTDSIIFNNLTLFDYKNGLYKKEIGRYIEFYILVFEGENVVNTIDFNNKSLPPLKRVDDLVDHLTVGIKNNFVKHVAEASSESIIRNQHRLKYDILNEVLMLQKYLGGSGILGAHSGDMVGIIFDEEEKLNNAYDRALDLRGYRKYKIKTLEEWDK